MSTAAPTHQPVVPMAPARAMPQLELAASLHRPPIDFIKLDGNIHVAVRTITPEMARSILANLNTRNRKMKSGAIIEYSRDMASWQWALNGEAIIFDNTTTLLNGQNRLAACILADTPFDTLVVWGARTESMNVMDRGVKRTAADVFGMNDIEYAALTAAAVNVLNAYKRGTLGHQGGNRSTMSEALAGASEWAEGLHETFRILMEVNGGAQVNVSPLPGMSPSLITAMFYMTRQFDEELARQFWAGVIGGERLERGDARLALRNVLIRERPGTRSRQSRVAALIIKAWNYWLDSRHVLLLRYGANEDFPSMTGYKDYGYEAEKETIKRRPGSPKPKPKTVAKIHV